MPPYPARFETMRCASPFDCHRDPARRGARFPLHLLPALKSHPSNHERSTAPNCSGQRSAARRGAGLGAARRPRLPLDHRSVANRVPIQPSSRCPRCTSNPRTVPSIAKPHLRATRRDAPLPTTACHWTPSSARSVNPHPSIDARMPTESGSSVGAATDPGHRAAAQPGDAPEHRGCPPHHDHWLARPTHDDFAVAPADQPMASGRTATSPNGGVWGLPI